VCNLLRGDKVAVERLLTHPDIKAVTAAPLATARRKVSAHGRGGWPTTPGR